MTFLQFHIVYVVHMDAVSSRFLGGITGCVCAAQHIRDGFSLTGNRRKTDTNADIKSRVFPNETKFLDYLTNVVGSSHGIF